MAERVLDTFLVLALPLTNSLARGKSFNLSRTQFPICWVRKLELVGYWLVLGW